MAASAVLPLLPLAATLCFRGFNEVVQSTFSNINHLQIIHNASIKHTCVDEFLCQIDAPVQHTMEFTSGRSENYIIFYAEDEEGQNLQSVIPRDLEKFPSYSNVLIVHFNVGLQPERIVNVAFKQFVLNVTVLYVHHSGVALSRNNMSTWLPSMRNQTIRIALFNYEPFVYYSAKKGLYDGIEMKILENIINDWDVIYFEHKPNTWENLHDEIAAGLVDIVLCGFWLDTVNYTTVDMTLYYTQGCNTFVVPKPTLMPLTYSYILQSFHFSLYIILFFIIVIISCLMKCFDKAHQRKGITNSYSRNLLTVYQVGIMVSANPLPKTTTLRLIIATWSLCAILINIFYNTGLTKRLFFPRYTSPVNTFADMQAQNVKWLLKSPDLLKIINSSQNYYKHNLLTLLDGSDTQAIDDREVDFSKFAAPVNIVHNYIDISLDRIATLAKNAKPLTECLANSYFVFPMKKYTPIKRIFDNKLQQITQAGLLKAWFNQFAYKHYGDLKLMPLFYQTYPDQDYLYHPRVLRLAHVQGAFVILIVGYFMATLILIKERFV